MGKSLLSPKDIVRNRSGNQCEKCGVILTRNVNGIPDGITARSVHHRHPKRDGGKDSVVCMVNLCLGCHKAIHEDEDKAALDGWIVFGRSPARVPWLGHLGWVLPTPEGGLDRIDFEAGRVYALARGEEQPRTRKRVATRPQFDRRRKSRKIARVA